ncbi:winged helix DNA-binding protein [Erythrobacter sp. SDW2]|uniref:winged helix DNA-binding protein n=1 Tax=Erythrobacter sp. SDW2 TaxID=2907154 RepID=UPI001F478A16|nr:winged helix DNA-binding protein [Erythrobacter sp. SDW2]UIP06438.1 winged helix DNA-binding protein [Erythrobacter sp. SDW2]
MHAAQLDYTPASDGAGMPVAVSIFADRGHARALIAEDVAGAGFRVLREAALSEVLEGTPMALGEIVLLDCPRVDGAILAALSRLDTRIACSGARLVVSTTIEALEDVFACLDQSCPRILVEPTRGERVVALGEELTKIARVRVREHPDRDQVSLLRLAEQVSEIARKIDALAPSNDDGRGSAFGFESPSPGFSGPDGGDASDRLTRAARPPLPDPRLVRQIIRQRQLRQKFFDGDLFADPAWDILLDLTAARAEHERVSVTSLCIASGVPPTTALRWISQMVALGLLERVEDEQDRRRAFIALSDRAADAMARYFAELGKEAARGV